MNSKYSSAALWTAASVLMVLITIFISIGLYVAYLRLDYSFDIGPKFSRFDGQLGWTLKPNASSFIKGSSVLKNTVYFDSTVFTDNLGFRSSQSKKLASPGGILAIGDSWTFGYCVDYEDSYPFFLEQELSMPVTNMGVPAYGSGSTYGLLERHVAELKPKVVVYFTIGLWSRSFASFKTTNELAIFKKSALLPHFVYDYERKKSQLIYPEPNRVSNSVQEGVYPGGSLTAGYNLWNYLWHVKLEQLLNKIRKIVGLGPKQNKGQVSANFNDNAHLKLPTQLLMEYELNLYLELAEKYDFQFVLMEGPHGDTYSNAVEQVNLNSHDKKIIYISPDEFHKEVYVQAEILNLPEEERRVPYDGHFASGSNKLIAKLVANTIRKKIPTL